MDRILKLNTTLMIQRRSFLYQSGLMRLPVFFTRCMTLSGIAMVVALITQIYKAKLVLTLVLRLAKHMLGARTLSLVRMQ